MAKSVSEYAELTILNLITDIGTYFIEENLHMRDIGTASSLLLLPYLETYIKYEGYKPPLFDVYNL